MLHNLKPLIVVLAIALTLFALAKPFVVKYVDPHTYVRRRNIWLTLTIVGFLSPSIWLYALVAMPLMFWGAKNDENPLALYVLIAFAIPNASVYIPTVGIGQLMQLNQRRMLSIAILVPLMFRSLPIAGMADSRRWTLMDLALLGLGLLQLALVLPYDSVTNTMRRGLVFFLDTFVMFYVFARLAPNAKAIREVMACLTLSIGLLCGIAIFESLRGWLLYIQIGPGWGATEGFTAYLIRGSLLRAQASAGHSLTLGYLASVAFGLWLYLSSRENNVVAKAAIFGVLIAGVFVTGSRGAWVTSMLIFMIHLALQPNAGKYLARVIPVLVVLVAIAYVTPLKEAFIDKLPIIGKSDQDTVEYRQQIAEVSWRLIKQNPFFGDPFALRNMEELRQGQGIIDIMNGYANVAVFTGGVGFALFITTFVLALWRTFQATLQFRSTDRDLAALGGNLLACMLGSLFFVGTAAVEPTTYWLAGIMASFCGLAVRRSNETAFVPMSRRFQ